jgi:hypothetical protein
MVIAMTIPTKNYEIGKIRIISIMINMMDLQVFSGLTECTKFRKISKGNIPVRMFSIDKIPIIFSNLLFTHLTRFKITYLRTKFIHSINTMKIKNFSAFFAYFFSYTTPSSISTGNTTILSFFCRMMYKKFFTNQACRFSMMIKIITSPFTIKRIQSFITRNEKGFFTKFTYSFHANSIAEM